MNGAKIVKKVRTGAASASAVPSEWPSAMPFGTSSPSTTWTNVSSRYASAIARNVARYGSNAFASACSPSAPMASEVSVTPSCIAAMKRGGSPVIRSTSRARRLPWWCSSMIRVRRAVTRPYSAATKSALSRIRTATPTSS